MGNSFLTKRGQRPVRTPLDQCKSRFTVGTHVSNRHLNGDYAEDFTILPDPIFFENNGHVFVIVKEVVRTVYRCGKYAIVSHRNLLKKRKEKPKIKAHVKPIRMCEIFFKKGHVLNNSKVIKSEKPDFVLGNELTFVESDNVVYAKFINDGSGIEKTWIVYQGGEYAKIIKTN